MDFLGIRKIKWRLLPGLLLSFRIVGKGWNDFYRWLLDRLEQDNSLDRIFQNYPKGIHKDGGLYEWSRGKYHLEFMRRNGLKSNHTVLDFGCGYGRTAIPLIRFLEKNRYFGVDLSSKRITMAKEWVSRESLTDKNPYLAASDDSKFSYLNSNSVDVIWTYSVFTHMPEREMKIILREAKRVLTPNGIIFFSYSAVSDDGVTRPSIKDFRYPENKMAHILNEEGYDFEKRADWDDDLEESVRSSVSRMLVLRVAGDSNDTK